MKYFKLRTQFLGPLCLWQCFFKWLQGHLVGLLQMIFFTVQNNSFLWVSPKVCPRKRTTSKSVGSLRRPKVIGGRQLLRRQEEEDSTSRPGGRKRRGSHCESSGRRRGADRGGGGGEGRARASARLLLLLQVCLCSAVHCCALLSAGVPSARTFSCHRRHTTQSASLGNSYELSAQ